MKRMYSLAITSLLLLSFEVFATTPFNQPPDWAKKVVWYQIFVERFSNGDVFNDPKPENTTVENMKIIPPKGWKITPWTQDWFRRDSWMNDSTKTFGDLLQYRRYGGDLQGVLDKLDYLQDLGITALYFNPINDAPSLHKYDARSYHHIDVNFGPDPDGDNRIIASENPGDPTTWKWTSADQLFLKVIGEAHKRGMKVIMDYSWNHTGTLFWAWQDILKNQSRSPYRDWYNIASFDDPTTPQNEFSYSGWYGNAYMPEFKKTDITTERINGRPYEGNMCEGVKKHIFAVSKRWLAPDGDLSKGVDGYRLDVADQIGLGFWRDYRKYIRSIQPDAYLVGEIWWEKWPNKLMDPTPYCQGDMFDAVMFYQVYKPARYFFAKTDVPADARQMKDSIEFEWNRLRPECVYAMMNVSSTHDTPRLLTDFFNPNKYKYLVSPNDNPLYKTGKPDQETYRRLNLYLVHLFTTIGAPQIWNGEEMGMWGADDPFCRKPLWWKNFRFEPENRNNVLKAVPQYDKVGFNRQQFDWYKKLIGIRNDNPVLSDGKFEFLLAEGNKLGYKRSNARDEIIVYFNMNTRSQYFPINPAAQYIDLLSGEKVTGETVKLKSLSAVILKKQ